MIGEPVLDRVYKPLHTVSTDRRVQMAVQENQIVQDALAAAQAELGQIQTLSDRALAVRAVENLMSAHFYSFWANQRADELALYWSREKEDIAYALEDRAYIGREAVYGYYVTDYAKAQAEKLARLAPVLGVENKPENLGIGDSVYDMSTSPFIQVAADCQTAQAIVITMSYRIELDSDGQPKTDHIRSRFGFDFVKEPDGWKIWHVRQLADIALPFKLGDPNQPRAMGDTSFFPAGNGPAPKSDFYTPKTVPSLSPALPRPYESWQEGQAVTGTPLTRRITIAITDVADAVGIPKVPQSMMPGMPPMPTPTWGEGAWLAKACREIARQAQGADEVELAGGGASWIFAALAHAIQPASACIFIPPMNQFVRADPIPMGDRLRADAGVVISGREAGDRFCVEVAETYSCADQGEMAKKFFANARIPAVQPGKIVLLSGMMPNFVAVPIACSYAAAGAKAVAIRLSSETEYTCCITNCDTIQVGDKLS